MKQIEYEQKKRECWENFWDEISGNIDFAPGVDDRMKEHIYDTFDRAYALGKQETKQESKQEIKQETDVEETVISGWVARDMNDNLYVYCHKPKRNLMECLWEGEIVNIPIYNDTFPDLSWSDEPQEVELIIKRKKNG